MTESIVFSVKSLQRSEGEVFRGYYDLSQNLQRSEGDVPCNAVKETFDVTDRRKRVQQAERSVFVNG